MKEEEKKYKITCKNSTCLISNNYAGKVETNENIKNYHWLFCDECVIEENTKVNI